MLNQESPQTDEDVIDWLVNCLREKQRSRRGIIKKLKELGLIFKAPTKKSNAAAANRNLFIREEDDMLRKLYDEHRTDDDCFDQIMKVFSKKRNKKTVINRMIQLGLIADKSEIMPANEMRENGRSDSSDNDSSDDEDNNRDYSKDAKYTRNHSMSHSKSNYTINNRDITNYRMELEESLKEAFEWIIESLKEAMDDFEEPSDEISDAIPLVPINESQKQALENPQFQNLLKSINLIQPNETEAYWKIPANMMPDELHKRAQILAGEMPNDNMDDKNSKITNRKNNNSDNEDDDDDESNLFSRLRAQHNALVYNNSDNEDDRPKPPTRTTNKDKQGVKLNTKLVKKLHPQVIKEHPQAMKWILQILHDKIAKTKHDMLIAPTTDEQSAALEDENFRKILTAINFIPPDGDDIQWQIPASFTLREFKKRAQMLAFENDDDEGEDEEKEENEQEEEDNNAALSSSSDESEQMVIKRKKPKAQKLSQKSNSENEADNDLSINTQQIKKRLAELESSSEDEDADDDDNESDVNQSLPQNKKKSTRHILDSSDDENDENMTQHSTSDRRKSEKRERSQSPDENEMNASNHNQMKKIRRIIDSDDE
jgi:timeless